METQWLPVSLVVWFTALAGALDARQQARFVQLGTGLLFARGRRTVTSWLRGGAAGRDYKRYYYLLGSVGRKTSAIAGALLRILLHRLPGDGPGTPLVFAIDDSPTKRYGPHVEGAGKHHNPTPGPAGSPFLYGHVWVCLARLVRHSLWGAIALPILSHLYIRAAVRAPRRGRWQASQPHSGTGRVPVPLRPRLGLSGPPGPTLALGSDRPADPLALVHPSQGCRLDGGLLRLAVPHQVGAGRRPDRVAGPAVGARSPADLGGNRRGLRQAAVLEADAGCGGDGDQSAAVRCGLVVVAAGGRSRPEEGSRPAAEVRQGPDRPGQTRGWQTGLFSLYGRMVVKKYKTLGAVPK